MDYSKHCQLMFDRTTELVRLAAGWTDWDVICTLSADNLMIRSATNYYISGKLRKTIPVNCFRKIKLDKRSFNLYI